MCDIYTEVTANKPRTMKLTIVRQRDKLEIVFKVIIVMKYINDGFDHHNHNEAGNPQKERRTLYSLSIKIRPEYKDYDHESQVIINLQNKIIHVIFSISCVRTDLLLVKVTFPMLTSFATCTR